MAFAFFDAHPDPSSVLSCSRSPVRQSRKSNRTRHDTIEPYKNMRDSLMRKQEREREDDMKA